MRAPKRKAIDLGSLDFSQLLVRFMETDPNELAAALAADAKRFQDEATAAIDRQFNVCRARQLKN